MGKSGTRVFSVKIPTEVHLKKFAVAQLGAPIKLSNKNLFGTVILSLLQKPKMTVGINKQKTGSIQNKLKNEIICVAPFSIMKDVGTDLTSNQVIQINRLLDHLFIETLSLYVAKNTVATKRQKGIQDAIISFCELYQIVLDVDINYEALKKAEYRLRTGKKNNSFVCPFLN